MLYEDSKDKEHFGRCFCTDKTDITNGKCQKELQDHSFGAHTRMHLHPTSAYRPAVIIVRWTLLRPKRR